MVSNPFFLSSLDYGLLFPALWNIFLMVLHINFSLTPVARNAITDERLFMNPEEQFRAYFRALHHPSF
jgi:hypothetical protein